MKILALANQKGGVAKTTSALNIAAALKELGHKVLIIDLDPQGNLTDALGFEADELEKTVFDVLQKKPKTAIEKVFLKANGMTLVPANVYLSRIDIVLGSEIGRETQLRKALHNMKEEFDYVVIDCPPALGLLTINAFGAATHVLIPVQSEYFPMKGMMMLQETIDDLKEDLNPALKIAGVFATRYHGSKNLHRDVVANLKQNLGDKFFSTIIRDNITLSESPVHSQSVFDLDNKSNGAQDYMNLTKEILERV